MPLRSSPSHTAYLLPPDSTSIFMLCDTFHPHCLSVFSSPTLWFPSFLSFTCFSCLSLFYVISSRCLPPCPHCASTPFSLLLIFLPLRSPASLTGTEKGLELTPVAAVSVHLLASDGVELQVNEPITLSVPLPADCGLKENDHIDAWRFDPRLGMY